MEYSINVGDAVGDVHGRITIADIARACQLTGHRILSYRFVPKGADEDEGTFVVRVKAYTIEDRQYSALYAMACILEQQAISVLREEDGLGFLIGPFAHTWDGGIFNPEKFKALTP
jgi:hypothetical protein